MKDLNAQDLLIVWEHGLNQPLLQKALFMLTIAYPEITPTDLAKLSIGLRDRYLLQLRAQLFGQQLMNTAVCPECKESTEWDSSVEELLISPDDTHSGSTEFDTTIADYSLHFRLINSLDIATIANSKNSESAQQQLLAQCLIKAEYQGKICAIEQLPKTVIQKLNQQLDELDPQADIRISLSCPECSNCWDVLFDISSFLWSEINGWAERMLYTIHKLAMAYGWSEQEILTLSPVRRQLYLGMLES